MADSERSGGESVRSARLRRRADPRGRTAALTVSAVALTTLLAAVALRLAGRGEAFSHRVVVAAHGCGAPCDDQVARALADDLAKLGFDAVAPAGLRAPEAVRAFAREHGARFGVTLRLSVEQSTRLDDAAQRVGANVALYVMDAARDEAPQPSFVLRGVEEAGDERTARLILAQRLLGGLLPVIGSALLTSEPVRSLQRGASGLEQQAAALALKRRERDVTARETAIREYRMYCESNDEALASPDSGQCVSHGCAEEYLVGVLGDGRSAVVHDSTDAAVFPLAPDSTARGFLTSERLWLVPRQGERKLLAEAANFYSRPDLSQDGSTLAFIEQRLGHARLYAYTLATGERTLVRSARPPRHLSDPHLAPDGSRVLYYEHEVQRGRAALFSARLRPPAEPRELLPHAIDARFAVLRVKPTDAPRLLVAALVASEPADMVVQVLDPVTGETVESEGSPGPALLLLDPDSGEIVARQDGLTHHLRALGAVYEGSLLLSWEDRGCGFARYVPDEPLTFIRTEACPRQIRAGRGGVFAHAVAEKGTGFRSLVRVDVESGKLELLTRPSQDVQNPLPAAAAEALAYERVMPRKYGELQHVAVCFDDR